VTREGDVFLRPTYLLLPGLTAWVCKRYESRLFNQPRRIQFLAITRRQTLKR